jgi:hypothetical protein
LFKYWANLHAACAVGGAGFVAVAVVQTLWGDTDALSAGEIDLMVLGGAVFLSFPILLVASVLEPFVRLFQRKSSMKFSIGFAVTGGAVSYLTSMVLHLMSNQSFPSRYEALKALGLIQFGVQGGLIFGFLARQSGMKEI